MVQDYNYTPEQAARASGVRDGLPASFFYRLQCYRGWEQMWQVRDDMKREAQSSHTDKLKLTKLKDDFAHHPMHELYVQHVRSDEGQRLYRELIDG